MANEEEIQVVVVCDIKEINWNNDPILKCNENNSFGEPLHQSKIKHKLNAKYSNQMLLIAW